MNDSINYLLTCKNSTFCSGPVVSGLTNKFGCRPVTFAGSIVACAGFLFASFSNSVPVLMLTYGVLGGKICNLPHPF